jgi:hypothetical protein
MSRFFSILFCVLFFGLMIVATATEQNHPNDPFSITIFIVNTAALALIYIGMILYCGFAALHATQYISSPYKRSWWLIFTILFNVLGSCYYYLTEYQSFRAKGQGSLMSLRKTPEA